LVLDPDRSFRERATTHLDAAALDDDRIDVDDERSLNGSAFERINVAAAAGGGSGGGGGGQDDGARPALLMIDALGYLFRTMLAQTRRYCAHNRVAELAVCYCYRRC
jgi:hypothetical protein